MKDAPPDEMVRAMTPKSPAIHVERIDALICCMGSPESEALMRCHSPIHDEERVLQPDPSRQAKQKAGSLMEAPGFRLLPRVAYAYMPRCLVV
jgi:hypothetical protein